MIKSAHVAKELVVDAENKIGVLAKISKIVAEHGINIEAVAGYAKDEKKIAEIMLVTDDNRRASEALEKGGYESVRETDVIMIELENKPGALKNLSEKLASEEIDINYAYGTICGSGCPAKMVISTSNNEKALLLLAK